MQGLFDSVSQALIEEFLRLRILRRNRMTMLSCALQQCRLRRRGGRLVVMLRE